MNNDIFELENTKKYIEFLEKEIERLNENNLHMQEEMVRTCEKYYNLQDRIEKAIEYISDYENYCDENECDCTSAYFEELLDILKGSDKE